MRVSGLFLSKIYCEDIFILSSDVNVKDYFYINGQIPCFYEEALSEAYIKSIKINLNILLRALRINVSKMGVLRSFPIKPVIYTAIDRRGLKEIKYYTDKDFKHILIDIDKYKI